MEFNATLSNRKLKCVGDYIYFPLNKPSSLKAIVKDVNDSKAVFQTFDSNELLLYDALDDSKRGIDGLFKARTYLNKELQPKSQKPTLLSLPDALTDIWYTRAIPWGFVNVFQNNIIGIGDADEVTNEALFEFNTNITKVKSSSSSVKTVEQIKHIPFNSSSYTCIHIAAKKSTDLSKSKAYVKIRKGQKFNVLLQGGYLYPTNSVVFLTMVCVIDFNREANCMSIQSVKNYTVVFSRDDVVTSNSIFSLYQNYFAKPLLLGAINFVERIELENPEYGKVFQDRKLISEDEEKTILKFLKDNNSVPASKITEIYYLFSFRVLNTEKLNWTSAFGYSDGITDSNNNLNVLCKWMLNYRRKRLC
jgi:hypothetical protein